MTSFLITGGAGFIGSRLARRLAEGGNRVVVFDSLHPQVHGAHASTPQLPDGVDFVRGDVRDVPALSEAVAAADPDVVYHLAAETGTGQSYDEPARYCDVNVQGTCHLVEAVRALPERARRIVLASSRAVYGEGAYLDANGSVIPGCPRRVTDMKAGRFAPMDASGVALQPCATPENLPPTPASIYASTKLMQEYTLEQAFAGTSTNVIVLRFQNVYGPGQSLRNAYTGVLSIFSKQILDGKELNIFEDGEIGRDFVFVDDVVRSLDAAGRVEAVPNGPINVGSGEVATIIDAARILLAALGKSPERVRVTGDFRPGDVRYCFADISRAAKFLGWRPEVSLESGLVRLAEWASNERREGRI